MSLSTSSFRGLYLKVFSAISLSMVVSLALVRLFGYLNNAGGDTLMTHVNIAREALPEIVGQEEDLVMVFGSSMVGAGFIPHEFDRSLKRKKVKVKSYNFGFGGLNPLFQDYLSRRIGEAFSGSDKRLKLALIEFNPFQTTRRRHERSEPVKDSFITLLASDKELWEIARKDPKWGIGLLNIRYLRDNLSAAMITSGLSKVFRQQRERSGLSKSDPDYKMDENRLSRIHHTDIIDLHFDDELVDAFIRTVHNFQKFSDRVEVILLPKNTKWIKNPPEAMARMEEVLDRIERETGILIRNFQEIDEVTPTMFSDTTHLNHYHGAKVFTRFLARVYAPYLKP